jgi:hypothetical protein
MPSPQHERLESERQILGRGKICLSPNDSKISKMPQWIDFGYDFNFSKLLKIVSAIFLPVALWPAKIRQ